VSGYLQRWRGFCAFVDEDVHAGVGDEDVAGELLAGGGVVVVEEVGDEVGVGDAVGDDRELGIVGLVPQSVPLFKQLSTKYSSVG
jgi:hypothetical protein